MPLTNLNLIPDPVTVVVDNSSGNGGSNPAEPATAGEQISITKKRNVNFTLPAGAYYIDLQVTDFNGVVNVNGQDIHYGGRFHREAKFNPVANQMDFVPGINIQSAGVNYTYTISYPSTAAVSQADL